MENGFKISGDGVFPIEYFTIYDKEFHYREVDSNQSYIIQINHVDIDGGDIFTSIERVNEELMRRIKIYQDCLLRQKKKM